MDGQGGHTDCLHQLDTIFEGFLLCETNLLAPDSGPPQAGLQDPYIVVKIFDSQAPERLRAIGAVAPATAVPLPRHARSLRAREQWVPRALSARHAWGARAAGARPVQRPPGSQAPLDVPRGCCGRICGPRAVCRCKNARAHVGSCVSCAHIVL